jgi:hypothetical protein
MHPSPQLPPIGPWRGLPPLFRPDDRPRYSGPRPPSDKSGCLPIILIFAFTIWEVVWQG